MDFNHYCVSRDDLLEELRDGSQGILDFMVFTEQDAWDALNEVLEEMDLEVDNFEDLASEFAKLYKKSDRLESLILEDIRGKAEKFVEDKNLS